MTQPSNDPFATTEAGEAAIVTEETPQKKRPGRKVNPLTAAIREYDTAFAKADRARTAYSKVADVSAKLEQAEIREEEAYAALQKALGESGLPLQQN